MSASCLLRTGACDSPCINLKLANNTTVKATVISAASVQSASSAIIKAASAIQQQTVVWGQFRVLPQPRSKRQSPPHLLVVFKLLEQCISPAAFPGHVCCIILKGQPFQQNECSAV